MIDLQAVFSPQGALSKAAPHYRFRPGQVELTKAIEKAITERSVLVAEAGTGVGKTYAYLAPLLLGSGKSLISTATKHLQDQIFLRDLPRVKAALGVSADIALLKGRSNYLCLYRLEQHEESGRFTRAEDAAAFREIVFFAGTTQHGDIAECSRVPETSPVWSMATSTRENCLGQNCPRLKDCHVMAARKRALEADVVVVNHHLFCADLALREEGMADLLPTVDVVVIDEAHALPEIAAQFFGRSVSSGVISHFARDTLAAGLTLARDAASWPDVTGRIDRAASGLRLLMTEGRIAWDRLSPTQQTAWIEALNETISALVATEEILSLNAARDPELMQLHLRSEELIQRLKEFRGGDIDRNSDPALSDSPHDLPSDAHADEISQAHLVRWIEASRFSVTLHLTPFDVAPQFREEIKRHQRAWIFVSATLAVAGQFDHFQERMGLTDARCMTAESPFDYAQQGLLFVPSPGPDPKAHDAIRQLLAAPGIVDLINDIPGGVFVLCTTHRAVTQAGDFFKGWAVQHPERLILIQGELPRHQLIEQFRQHGRAILVGSQSFWEGVDVPGRALAMVLIDKLPFAPPDDPVLEARTRWCRKEGRDPFTTLQLPEAAINLKQGVGRLIRSETDRGLILIGDRRLAETGYGRRILRSLPPFQRTRDLATAKAWVARELPEL